MNKCQNKLVCYGLYPSSACFCHFKKEEKKCQRVCRHDFLTQADCIIFFFLMSVYSIYKKWKVGMPKNISQSKDPNKMAHGRRFSSSSRPLDAK